MKKLYLTLITLILSITFSYGEGVYVSGYVDCGTWHQARNDKKSGLVEHFIQGFINGISIGTDIEVWNANGIQTSPQTAFLYIDNFCKAKPLANTIQASLAFIDEKTNNAYSKISTKGNK